MVVRDEQEMYVAELADRDFEEFLDEVEALESAEDYWRSRY